MAEFKMNVTGTAFDILSSKLYKLPYHAIVRELVLNGIDAHRVAGYDGPVKIGYESNDEEQYWFCRDFGDGLTQFDVERIYTSFFSSTKKTDGEQIGCFGLGSKTPFSVSDEYLVISIVNTGDNSNEKTIYRMFKGEGAPQWEILSQSKTVEPTGLEIRISFKDISLLDMNNAMTDVVRNIVEDVELCNVPENIVENIEVSKRLSEVEKNYRLENRSGIWINLNGYMYFISEYDIYHNVSDEASYYTKTLLKTGAMMIVNASKTDLTLTPSRENVHFDSKTVEFLKKAIPETFKIVANNLYNDGKYGAIYMMSEYTRDLFVEFFKDLAIIEKSVIAFDKTWLTSNKTIGVKARKLMGNMQLFTTLLSGDNQFKFIKVEGPVAERHVREVLPGRLKTFGTSYKGLLLDSLVAEFEKYKQSNFDTIYSTTDEEAIDTIKKYHKCGIQFVSMVKGKSEKKKASSLDEAFWKHCITQTSNYDVGTNELEAIKRNEDKYTKFVVPSTYFGSSNDLSRLTGWIFRTNNKITKKLAGLWMDKIGNAVIHIETNPKRYEKFLKEGYASYPEKLKEFFTNSKVCEIFVKAKTIEENLTYIKENVLGAAGGSFILGATVSLVSNDNFKEFNISKLCGKMLNAGTDVRYDIFRAWGEQNIELYKQNRVDERVRKIVNSNDFGNMSKLLYTYANMTHISDFRDVLVPSFKEYDNDSFAELANLIDELQ
jgi:hypothetical protein